MKGARLEGASMRELLRVGPRGIVEWDIAWGKPRRRKFAKTSAKRAPGKGVRA